jgi:hypothetical protein
MNFVKNCVQDKTREPVNETPPFRRLVTSLGRLAACNDGDTGPHHSFSNCFSHAEPATAETGLQAHAVWWNHA